MGPNITNSEGSLSRESGRVFFLHIRKRLNLEGSLFHQYEKVPLWKAPRKRQGGKVQSCQSGAVTHRKCRKLVETEGSEKLYLFYPSGKVSKHRYGRILLSPIWKGPSFTNPEKSQPERLLQSTNPWGSQLHQSERFPISPILKGPVSLSGRVQSRRVWISPLLKYPIHYCLYFNNPKRLQPGRLLENEKAEKSKNENPEVQ